MSYAVDIVISCASCTAALKWHRWNEGGLSISSALHWAELRGWQASAKVQRCPKHRTRHPRAHVYTPSGERFVDCSGDLRGRSCWYPPEHYIHAEGPVAS